LYRDKSRSSVACLNFEFFVSLQRLLFSAVLRVFGVPSNLNVKYDRVTWQLDCNGQPPSVIPVIDFPSSNCCAMPDQSVSREVVPGAVWCIATPFVLGGAKVGGRTSIIRLANGDLFVISPTAIEEGTKAFVDSIGKVKYLAAPNVGVRPLTHSVQKLNVALPILENVA
jgi:hypothetical protein